MASHEAQGILPRPDFGPDSGPDSGGLGPNVLLIAAPFYRKIADWMIEGARAEIEACGGTHDLIEVPGALEIPAAIRMAQRAGGYEAYVALGCIIRGETYHFELVCNESARGITLLGLEGLAIGNGVLTTEDMAQAEVRADPSRMNKGGGAAAAALHLAALARRFGAVR